jgi:nitrate reductase molybdenum cofactor assembly chaperone
MSRQYWSLLGSLFEYPSEKPLAAVSMACRALEETGNPALRAAAGLLREFRRQLERSGLDDLRLDYVALFDLDPQCSPFLTWHVYGDTPRQGRALAALGRLYRDSGYELNRSVMPDYLPLMLEFLSIAPDWAAETLSQGFMTHMCALGERIGATENRYSSLGRAFAATAADVRSAEIPRGEPPVRSSAVPKTPVQNMSVKNGFSCGQEGTRSDGSFACCARGGTPCKAG